MESRFQLLISILTVINGDVVRGSVAVVGRTTRGRAAIGVTADIGVTASRVLRTVVSDTDIVVVGLVNGAVIVD